MPQSSISWLQDSCPDHCKQFRCCRGRQQCIVCRSVFFLFPNIFPNEKDTVHSCPVRNWHSQCYGGNLLCLFATRSFVLLLMLVLHKEEKYLVRSEYILWQSH